MRELVVENQEILVIPQNFKSVNKGIVKSVNPGDFVLELKYVPTDIAINNFCEFYTQTSTHGKLFFSSYPIEIEGKMIRVVSPSKHSFLQRRQYTRIKFLNTLSLMQDGKEVSVDTLDISAGGMKLKTCEKLDIDSIYEISLPILYKNTLNCEFQPIRIEKRDETNDYVVSGRFKYSSNYDRMVLTQYCAKRSIEIKCK